MSQTRAFVRQSDNSEAAIRPFRPDDLAVLVDLWIASWRETMPDIDFETRRDWIATFLATPRHATIVAEDGSHPLGFMTLEGPYLHQLVVAPGTKGSGIASILLDAAKARSAQSLTLDVNQANARAVRFYEREGFRRVRAGVSAASGLATWTMVWP